MMDLPYSTGLDVKKSSLEGLTRMFGITTEEALGIVGISQIIHCLKQGCGVVSYAYVDDYIKNHLSGDRFWSMMIHVSVYRDKEIIEDLCKAAKIAFIDYKYNKKRCLRTSSYMNRRTKSGKVRKLVGPEKPWHLYETLSGLPGDRQVVTACRYYALESVRSYDAFEYISNSIDNANLHLRTARYCLKAAMAKESVVSMRGRGGTSENSRRQLRALGFVA